LRAATLELRRGVCLVSLGRDLRVLAVERDSGQTGGTRADRQRSDRIEIEDTRPVLPQRLQGLAQRRLARLPAWQSFAPSPLIAGLLQSTPWSI
jgi:hypothetical protein